MNILQNEFHLPITLDYDNEYYDYLSDKFAEFSANLKKGNLLGSTISATERNAEEILDALESYYVGDIICAQNKILDLLIKYKNNKILFSSINDSYAIWQDLRYIKSPDNATKEYISKQIKPLNLYKARIGDPVDTYYKEDMLHIPFNRRELVKTQRFSIPGIPFIYLATSTYGCWIEMGKPSSQNFFVSSYKPDPTFKVLNLIGTWHLSKAMSEYSGETHYKFDPQKTGLELIELWPLICATSIHIKQRDRAFKSEYIISQLIMLALHNLGVDCISYYSKQNIDDMLAYPNCVNFAFLPRFKLREEYSSDIVGKFTITNAINMAEFERGIASSKYKVPVSFNNSIGSYPNHYNIAGDLIHYYGSVFSRFDNYLASQPYY